MKEDLKRILTTPGARGEIIVKNHYGTKVVLPFSVTQTGANRSETKQPTWAVDARVVWINPAEFIEVDKIELWTPFTGSNGNLLYLRHLVPFNEVTIAWCVYDGTGEYKLVAREQELSSRDSELKFLKTA